MEIDNKEFPDIRWDEGLSEHNINELKNHLMDGGRSKEEADSYINRALEKYGIKLDKNNELSEEEKEELLKAAQPYGKTLSPAERKERMIRLIMRALDKTYDEAVKIEKEFSKMSDLKRARKRNNGF